MRTVFAPALAAAADSTARGVSETALRTGFRALRERFGLDWAVRDRRQRKRVMLMASKFDHCLADLLYRWRLGELPMEIVAVVSNHPRKTYRHLRLDGLPCL